ncbi:MAG TPA: class I SAM-dependent methyltransferase [Nitrospiraceae bacterium]|nr:class I SAM-dependent methyltransferase [Nitrospiraceae bacterium]
MNSIIPKSLPRTNEKVLEILSSHNPWESRVLDLGAGEGYFSSLLSEKFLEKGIDRIAEHMSACDLFPQEFKFGQITCDFCDFNSSLPYSDNSFKAVCSIEVIEHLENIFHLMREVYRILQPGGVAVITTPNILNMNSRLTTFITGFPLLYGPLPLFSHEPQDLGGHINPVSFYYLTYIAKRVGFKEIRIHTDRLKRSARLLALFLYPLIKIGEKILFRKMKRENKHIFEDNFELISNINSFNILLGRTLILEAIK